MDKIDRMEICGLTNRDSISIGKDRQCCGSIEEKGNTMNELDMNQRPLESVYLNSNAEDRGAESTNDDGNKPNETEEMTRGQILKNIILISVLFMLLFTCATGLTVLQSSLHIQEGMGVITQSVYYSVVGIATLFLPKPVVYLVGHKWGIMLSVTGFILWMAANGYAVWGTMITAVVFQGLCCGVLWPTKCAYFTIAAKKYAELCGEDLDVVMSKFFGIFFAIYRMSGVLSGIIQTIVLKQGKPDNYTGPSEEEIKLCGLNDCPSNNFTNENFEKPPSKVIWTLVGIYIGVTVMAFIMASIFVDNLPRSWLKTEDQGPVRCKKIVESIGATLKLTQHLNQIFIIPLSIYSGIERIFFSVELSKSYTTCCLGMWRITLLALPGSIVNAITSFASGRLVKYTGSLPMFITAMSVSIAIQMTLLLWKPHPSQLYMFILILLFQGFSEGLWKKQLNALCGTLFPLDSEAAYSNLFLWESVGMICGFAWSSYLCTSVKLYITMGFFYTGYGLVFVLYIHLARKKRKSKKLKLQMD